MRKVAGEHPFFVLIYMNSYVFHICFILFILLSYLIFDFVCLTLSSADTHGIAQYTRTYIRDTHTHAHTHTHKKSRKTPPKKKRCNQERLKVEKKERMQRKGEERRRKMREKKGEKKKERKKTKREGDGFRGVEERGY